LAGAGIDGARLDAEVLLAHVLRVERSFLLSHPTLPLSLAQAALYAGLIRRRAAREPLAYLSGRRWFYGLEFLVTSAVLIPRPETELLVEMALAWLAGRPEGATVVDVGTGSGAIAVALAVHTPSRVRILASDSSAAALAVAQENARQHCPGRITFLSGDLLTPLSEPVDLIVANLPYVAEAKRDDLMPEVRDHEPAAALFGGEDGLAVIERLLLQAPAHLRPGGGVMLEIGAGQGEAARLLAGRLLAGRHFPAARIAIHPDLAGLDRVLVITPPAP
jgi:release factor glutamine methyltransferase